MKTEQERKRSNFFDRKIDILVLGFGFWVEPSETLEDQMSTTESPAYRFRPFVCVSTFNQCERNRETD